MSQLYLAHHGVLGQKWGVRRFQNEDGSLKNAGKKRYKVSKESIDSRKRKIKKLKTEVNLSDPYYDKNYTKKYNRLLYEKEQLKNDKIKMKFNSKSEISGGKYYNKKLQQYLDEGYTKEEAEVNAKRLDRGRKFAIAAGVTAVAAIGAYAGFKYYKNNIDGTIKSGKKLQNVSSFARSTSEALYTSHNPYDNVKYRGVYGNIQMKKMQGSKDVYKNVINVTKDLKVASHKNAQNVLSNLISNDKQYADNLKNTISNNKVGFLLAGQTKHYRLLSQAEKELQSGKPGKATYRAANFLLTVHDNTLPGQDAQNRKFYDALKKAGYDALRDYNDESLSGYHALSANIIFNGAEKTRLSTPINMSNNKTKSLVDSVIGLGAQMTERYAPYALASVGIISVSNASENKNRKIQEQDVVAKYRKEHPNSKISSDKIIKSYYNS